MKKHELLDEEAYYYKDIHSLQINPQIKMSLLSTYLPIYLFMDKIESNKNDPRVYLGYLGEDSLAEEFKMIKSE